MPKEFQRSTRVAEQIQRELAGMVGRVLEDPRAGMVTVTAVQLSKDLSHARVFVSSLGGSLTHQELVQSLQHASGFMRHELGRAMKLRIMPELRFQYDETEERAARLEALIAKANAPDGGKGS
ncbi:MAG TPA: 30S ribosome-binding factor RbfA [Gammaproteobacteria bacterium]|jgi:ribosome-binding factor A|nr:30S ribosome-binding factor RbfA [Gammaproteobacteria bacterium]